MDYLNKKSMARYKYLVKLACEKQIEEVKLKSPNVKPKRLGFNLLTAISGGSNSRQTK